MTTKNYIILFIGILFFGLVSCKTENKKPEKQFVEEPPKSESSEYGDNVDGIVDREVELVADEQKKDILPNRIIDPNGKVGLITASTTKLELDELYGKENIRDTIIFSYEGIDVIGSQVSFENNNDNLYIVWKEDHLTPKTIIIKNKNSNWKTKKGIGVGSTIKEVEKANGRPFTVHPYEIDVYLAGTVENWNSGNFNKTGLNVQFQRTKDLSDVPSEEYPHKMMGGGLSSDDLLEKLGLQVETIFVSFQ